MVVGEGRRDTWRCAADVEPKDETRGMVVAEVAAQEIAYRQRRRQSVDVSGIGLESGEWWEVCGEGL